MINLYYIQKLFCNITQENMVKKEVKVISFFVTSNEIYKPILY